MTRISRSRDCGNSPKNKLLEELAIAIGRGDSSRFEELVTTEVVWQLVGRKKPIAGLDAARRALDKTPPALEIAIDHVVSHGRAGAVNGTTAHEAHRTAFCHMFEFNNTKGTHVKSVKTYSTRLR